MISINSMTSAHEAAASVAGLGPDTHLTSTCGRAQLTGYLRANQDYTELRLEGDGIRSANVTIERPGTRYGSPSASSVTWSSSSSNSGLENAEVTADLLTFATRVARLLDLWAADQLAVAGEVRMSANDLGDH